MNDLTPEELQAPRTAAQFLPWVVRRIEELASTDTGKRDIRFPRGLVKPLVEEALPLGIFALHHFGCSEAVSIALVLGSQNHDATIEDHRKQKSLFSFIEVTQAHEGKNHYLRMLALERDGHVNLLGSVHKSGTKATGIHIEVQGVALSHATVLEQELDRWE